MKTTDVKAILKIHDAKELFLKDQFDAALLKVDRALEINSKCVEAWVLKGKIYQKQALYAEAIKCFDEGYDLVKIKENHYQILFCKVQCLRLLKQFIEAYETINMAFKLVKKPGAFMFNLKGLICSDLASYEEALESFNIAISMDGEKTFDFVKSKILCLEKFCRYKEAHDTIDSWLKNHTDDINAYELKALLYLSEVQLDDAINWYDNMLEIIYAKQDKLKNQVFLLKISFLWHAFPFNFRTDIYTCEEKLKTTLLTLKDLEKTSYNLYHIKFYLEYLYVKLNNGHYGQAHKYIDKGIQSANDLLCVYNTKFHHGYYIRGLILINEGDYQKAAEAFQVASEYAPFNLNYSSNLAFSFILQAEFGQANAIIDKTLILKFPHVDASILQGLIALLHGEVNSAEKYFSQAESIVESEALLCDIAKIERQHLLELGLGLLAHRQGNDEVAKEKLKTPEICLKSVWYYHLKGLCFIASNDYFEAKKAFEEGVLQTNRNEILERCLCDVQVAIDKGEGVRLVSDKDREIVFLQQLSDKAMEKLEVSEQKREDSEETKKALQQALNKTIDEKEALEKERAHFNEKAAVLQKRIKTLEQQNAQMEKIKEENRTLSKENKSLYEEKKILIDETTKINLTVMRLETTIKSKDVLIEELKEKIDQQVSNFEKYKQESEKRFSKLEADQAKQKAKRKAKQKAKSDGNDGIRQKITDLFSVHETKKPENKLPIEMEESKSNDFSRRT